MISDNQMISGRQASWIFMLDMLAAGLFWLFCVLCPQICGQNCTAGQSSAFVRQGMTVRV